MIHAVMLRLRMLRSFLFQKLRYESLPNPVVYVRRSKYLNICKRLIRLAFYTILFILATISFGLIFVSSTELHNLRILKTDHVPGRHCN